MNIKKYVFLTTAKCCLLITIVLIFSTIGTAEENNTEKTKVIVISKDVGIDKDSNKYVVLVNIATNKIGHLIYLEEYYSRNGSDKLKLDTRIIYYNNTMTNNTLTLKVKRPLDKNGEQYEFVKAVAYIDNKRELNSWFKRNNKSSTDDNKKSPGFEIIVPIISMLSIVCLLRNRKR